jgi:HupE / UreJ protein
MLSRLHRRSSLGVLAIAIAAYSMASVWAHPMPNTVIAVSLGDEGARLDIAVPIPELRLALPSTRAKTADLLIEPYRSAVIDYFLHHCVVRSVEAVAQPVVAQALRIDETRDDNVGLYQELRLRLWVAATPTFNPRSFTLAYDAVIHQVPNHFAVVQVVRDFRAGVLQATESGEMGIIRYDFAHEVTPPLTVAAQPGSLWRGVRATIALGFHHVATGFDHLLFLATLLIVAPLRVLNGRWSLFQGWGYAARRFLAISFAFTLGHSLALLVGAYDLVPVPRRLIEVLIAASILVAAIHAIRPLFTGREWIVAAAFGTVHGLAFAEGLSGLGLIGVVRALAVAGFNIGVEGAQLVAMACAVPLLAASQWRRFGTIRVVAMSVAALIASVWMVQRAVL